MSGIIARAVGDGFQGREVRQHVYPSELGKTLWHLYREPFKQKRLHMLEVLIGKHPAGWDDLAVSSWTHVDQPPVCLCHGSHTMPEKLFTETTPGDHQWCYRIGVTTLYKAYMDVLFRPAHQTEWRILGPRILLQEPEPNWYVYEGLAANFAPLPPIITSAGDMEQPALSIETTEGIEQQARAIEAWAQQRGTHTPVWFHSQQGGLILVHPDGNKKNGWLFSSIVAGWHHDLPISSRLEGIEMALNSGAHVQAAS